MISGNTIGGTSRYPDANRLDRHEALRRYTMGSAWFSGEETKKGAIAPGQLADLAALNSDYFSVSEEEIKRIEAGLTIVDGRIVYGSDEFSSLAPAPLPIVPDWSPVGAYGGYHQLQDSSGNGQSGRSHGLLGLLAGLSCGGALWGSTGCDCFVY